MKNWPRRNFLFSAAAPFLMTGRRVPPRPNIVLLMADDQGWGDAGYHGHKILRTPCLDEMARHGVRLERFYAGAPVCSPTRGSCLTGRHPFRYGIFFANADCQPHAAQDERTDETDGASRSHERLTR